MRRWSWILAGAAALALFVDAATAQPPGPRDRPPGEPGGPRAGAPDRPGERGPRDFPPFRFPLMVALDADNDGELSAEEIAGAVAALKKLDKNNDGKLSREELRPEFPGPPGPGGRGPGGPPGPGARGPGGPAGPGFADRLMSLDRNGDGKIQKDEIPERMQPMLSRADTNGDGAIDKQEAQAAAEQFEQFRRERGDQPAGQPDRPRGERPPREGGDAPRGDRPGRPE